MAASEIYSQKSPLQSFDKALNTRGKTSVAATFL